MTGARWRVFHRSYSRSPLHVESSRVAGERTSSVPFSGFDRLGIPEPVERPSPRDTAVVLLFCALMSSQWL
jgi:hypothetical protein